MPIVFRLTAALVLLFATSVRAQVPSYAAKALPEDQAIVIDGRFDEPFWAEIEPLTDVTQVVPIEGADPTHPMEMRIAFTPDALYIALKLIEDPGSVKAQLMNRDANLDPDDRVEMWFDTFSTQRFAYWFQIGAAGSLGDALIADGGQSFNKSWDGIWDGRALVTDFGWQAELEIPFKTLAFAEGTETWGFNVRRQRKINDEEDRWASPSVGYRFFNVATGGMLTGLKGLRHGIGVDFIPYVKARLNNVARDNRTTGTADAGADLSYRITPSLVLRLTYNTDFAETEVDARQVNLTRFPLFFPEQRDFFLEDAGLFEFGAPSRRRDTIPYFSRRIGRGNSGEAIPIRFGTRLSGRVDDWNLGVLQTIVDKPDGSDVEGLGVARVTRNLGEESAIGGIFTGGNPGGTGWSQTGGVDVRLGDSRAFGEGRRGTLWAYWMGTSNDADGLEENEGDGQAFGLEAEYAGPEWRHRATFNQVEDEFDPALGFVSRRGIRRYRLDSSLTIRTNDADGLLRRINWRVRPTFVDSDEGEKQSWSVPFRWFGIALNTEDRIEFETHRIFERLDETFDIRDNIDVPVGDYYMTRHFLELEFSDRRPLSGGIDVQFGDFFGGDILRTEYSVSWIQSKFMRIRAGFEDIHADLPGGSFDTQVLESRFDFSFSPEVSFRNLAQWDTDSESLSVQSRLRWIFQPGQELFLVGLFGWDRPESGSQDLASTGQDLAFKINYTVRF